MLNIFSKRKLHNDVEIPCLGLGVYQVTEEEELSNTIQHAFELGYRLIDTAAFYDNEEGVGQAIKNSNIPREEIFVTTKVWNSDQGYENTIAAFNKSLEKLDLDYIDLYLIHWPIKELYLETWRALEDLYEQGKVRAIGVCNFTVEHLQHLIENSKYKPVLNQVELHPKLTQVELIEYCSRNNIAVQAWSPIARGAILQEDLLVNLAQKYNRSVAQIILRWHLQNRVLIIPKSSNIQRLEENASIFDFELVDEDMKKIHSINEDRRFGADPNNFQF